MDQSYNLSRNCSVTTIQIYNTYILLIGLINLLKKIHIRSILLLFCLIPSSMTKVNKILIKLLFNFLLGHNIIIITNNCIFCVVVLIWLHYGDKEFRTILNYKHQTKQIKKYKIIIFTIFSFYIEWFYLNREIGSDMLCSIMH